MALLFVLQFFFRFLFLQFVLDVTREKNRKMVLLERIPSAHPEQLFNAQLAAGELRELRTKTLRVGKEMVATSSDFQIILSIYHAAIGSI